MSDTASLYEFDRRARRPGTILVGVDEAGRGPLAGPVVAAAVRLDLRDMIPGLNDSKQVTPRRREALYERITDGAVWAVGMASPEEIDRHNILRASMLAMKRSLELLSSAWTVVLVDGDRMIPGVEQAKQRTLVGGDATSASVAAASIVAKVTRDRIMTTFSTDFPGYEFARHKGYPTALHRECIRRLGLCPIHRRSFCRRLVTQTSLTLEE